jgi:Flp pilus assembly protein TadD
MFDVGANEARGRRDLLLTTGLMATVAATFLPSLANGAVLDDPWVTVNNPYVQSLRGLPTLIGSDVWTGTAAGETSSLYRPVFMASFLANRLAFGNTVVAYHVGNLLIHAGAVLLVYRLLRALLMGRPFLSWLGAAWFGITPLNTEAVAWISARCDPLGTLFGVGALLANRRARPWLTVLLVTLGLLTKESFVCVPIIVAVDDFFVLRRPWRPELRKYWGIAGSIVAFAVARRIVGVPTATTLTAKPLGQVAAAFLTMAAALARSAFVPMHLGACRPYAPLSPWACLTVGLGIIVLSVALLVLCRRSQDADRWRVAVLGWIWFLLSLGPVAITGPNLGIVGDRYGYFPTIGLAILITATMDIVGRPKAPAWVRWTARGAGVVSAAALVALAVLSRARLRDWRDEDTLFRAALSDNPSDFYARYWLGWRAAVAGRLDEAEPLLRTSLELQPDSFRTHNALCFVLLNRNLLPEAELECKKSLAVNAHDPRTWVNLASIYVRGRAWHPALDAATQAVETKPRYAEAHYLRAVCLANLGQLPEAVSEDGLALELDPTNRGALSLADQLRAHGAATVPPRPSSTAD